jgi:hypothetical protein
MNPTKIFPQSQAHPTHVFTNTSTNSAPTADIPDDTSAIMNSAGAFESTEPDTIPDVTAEFLRSDNKDCDPESSVCFLTAAFMNLMIVCIVQHS